MHVVYKMVFAAMVLAGALVAHDGSVRAAVLVMFEALAVPGADVGTPKLVPHIRSRPKDGRRHFVGITFETRG